MTKLTGYVIARKNISRSPIRSFCLIFAVLIFSGFLFAGTVLITSLSNGAESLANRLGADIMIVPAGYDPHVDNILLTGKPSAFYLPENALSLVKELDSRENLGVEKISPQVFMATLRASCCAYPVQLMGIDYESDFIIKPWLDNTLHRELRDGEIILGCHSTGEPGDDIIFFDKALRIAGKLERTGMGFDSAVFMNRNTIIELAKAADRIKTQKLAANNDLISVIMIKLKAGSDVPNTARIINHALNSQGMYALFSKRFVSNISSSLVNISGVVKIFLVITWLMSVIVIALLFSLTVIERKHEFGILRSIGATRKKLTFMILNEALLISTYGALTGIIISGALIFAGSPFISEILHLPFILPSTTQLIFTGTASGVAAILTGLLASGVFALKAGHVDIHENLR